MSMTPDALPPGASAGFGGISPDACATRIAATLRRAFDRPDGRPTAGHSKKVDL